MSFYTLLRSHWNSVGEQRPFLGGEIKCTDSAAQRCEGLFRSVVPRGSGLKVALKIKKTKKNS